MPKGTAIWTDDKRGNLSRQVPGRARMAKAHQSTTHQQSKLCRHHKAARAALHPENQLSVGTSSMTDFSHVPTRQDAIHLRLEQWGHWVRVHPRAWATHPMWRNAKTPRQWDIDPHIAETINTLEAHEIERAVSLLPEMHRIVLR